MSTQSSAQQEGQDLPLVTVAILAYQRRDPLAVTLTKILEELDYPHDRLEIIVVDNASTDGTVDMVRTHFPQVRLIVNAENEGIAGWNRAFEVGRGDWFLVLDDDCYIEGDGLRRALDMAAGHDASLVSLRVLSDEPGEAFSDLYRTGVLAFWGCSALISRAAIDDVGGFDPGLFIWAHEVEFTARLLDRGHVHLVLPEVTSVHMKPLPRDFSVFSHRTNLRNFSYVAAKLMQPPQAAAALVHLLLKSCADGVVNRGAWRAVPGVLAGFRDGLRVRAPVRPEVSRLVRRDFVEYVNPLRFVRGPLTHWRLRFDPSRVRDSRQKFWAARPSLYPDRTTAFRVR